MDKDRINEIIDEKATLFIDVSDKIWECAETKFQENKSAKILCTVLEDEGFLVEKGIAGISTAFVASFGKGAPVIAILGEYDALSGLSQKSGVAKKEALLEGGNGHGCGHNLLGAGSLAAVVAVKKYMQEKNIKGTIRYYGCPGEEGGSGKTFMVREGVFRDVDVALTWHPLTHNTIMSIKTLANYHVYFKFRGTSAHAAVAPHLGRSALDAVELMNIGVNYLREHIIQEARVHYAVTNTGGRSPNVVQAEAEVLYSIRAPKLDQVLEIYERVCDIASGAAMMTGTECEIVFEKGCSNYIPNNTLEKLVDMNFHEVGTVQPEENERAFSVEIRNTLSEVEINGDLEMASQYMGGARGDILHALKDQSISNMILPYVYSSMLLSGSTDVGDVSWVVPTAQFSVACFAFGTPLHSWQTVAQGKSSFAHKGMLTAGKVLARTTVDVFLQPEVVANAKVELMKILGWNKYFCPIPPGIKPRY